MNIPKQEKIVEKYISSGRVTHIVTRNMIGKYVLYEVGENKYKKIKTLDNPTSFNKIVYGDEK